MDAGVLMSNFITKTTYIDVLKYFKMAVKKLNQFCLEFYSWSQSYKSYLFLGRYFRRPSQVLGHLRKKSSKQVCACVLVLVCIRVCMLECVCVFVLSQLSHVRLSIM